MAERTIYKKEFKEMVVREILTDTSPRGAVDRVAIARGLSRASIYRWIRGARGDSQGPRRISQTEFNARAVAQLEQINENFKQLLIRFDVAYRVWLEIGRTD